MTIHNCLNQSGIDLKLKLLKADEAMKFLSELSREVSDSEKQILEQAENVIGKYLDKYYSAQVQIVKDCGIDPENP